MDEAVEDLSVVGVDDGEIINVALEDGLSLIYLL